MISYKDRTYCLQGKECAHRSECPRYLTEEERKRAETLGLPICFSVFRTCFVQREDSEDVQ